MRLFRRERPPSTSMSTGQDDALAGPRRLAGGTGSRRDQVVLSDDRRWPGRASDDREQVGDRVLLIRRAGIVSRRDPAVRKRDPQAVAPGRNRLSALAVDLEVLPVEGPVPRRLMMPWASGLPGSWPRHPPRIGPGWNRWVVAVTAIA